jgi:hypothetical protein
MKTNKKTFRVIVTTESCAYMDGGEVTLEINVNEKMSLEQLTELAGKYDPNAPAEYDAEGNEIDKMSLTPEMLEELLKTGSYEYYSDMGSVVIMSNTRDAIRAIAGSFNFYEFRNKVEWRRRLNEQTVQNWTFEDCEDGDDDGGYM